MKMYAINQLTGEKIEVIKGKGKNETYYYHSPNGNRLRSIHKSNVYLENGNKLYPAL
jgi:hypothetical protein